jgi:hypothetical protein
MHTNLQASHAAFTLWSVSVSSIIALRAILMPPERAVRPPGRPSAETGCGHNGAAFAAYAAENSGFIPTPTAGTAAAMRNRSPARIADYWFGWVDVVALLGERGRGDHDRGGYRRQVGVSMSLAR